MVHHILVGVDGSERSRRALRWAAGEAAARRGVLQPVVIWHSPNDVGEVLDLPVDDAKIAAHARQVLETAIADACIQDLGVDVEPMVLHGDPARTLCDRSADAALLVVGSRGHGGFARAVLGSVSTTCAHHSQCPVVIVPRSARGVQNQDSNQIGRIMVGVDGSPGSRRALHWAVTEAAVRGVSIDAVVVLPDPYRGDTCMEFDIPYLQHNRRVTLEHIKAQLAEIVADAVGQYPAVTIDSLVLDGDPARTLCERSADTRLLVVGTRRHDGFVELIRGSVVDACAHRSRCPVVIVHHRPPASCHE